jgi:hypothetical protein
MWRHGALPRPNGVIDSDIRGLYLSRYLLDNALSKESRSTTDMGKIKTEKVKTEKVKTEKVCHYVV